MMGKRFRPFPFLFLYFANLYFTHSKKGRPQAAFCFLYHFGMRTLSSDHFSDQVVRAVHDQSMRAPSAPTLFPSGVVVLVNSMP